MLFASDEIMIFYGRLDQATDQHWIKKLLEIEWKPQPK
jgi:hypothetical protein